MIRDAVLTDMDALAKLHSESFNNHFLPKLGNKLLSKYYKEFLNDENIFIVSVDVENNINGLLLGTANSSIGRNSFIKNNKIKLTLRVALLCLKFDLDTWKRVKNFIKSKMKVDYKEVKQTENFEIFSGDYLSLLSICVSEKAKGMGISKLLVERFEEKLKTNSYEGYRLSVYKSNYRANGFYKKNGMSIYKESNEEYLFVKKLS